MSSLPGTWTNPPPIWSCVCLELVKAQREKEPPANFRDYHPLRGVSDRWLYGEKTNPLLGPGERSAVFAIQSKSEKYYKGVLGLHFFYLNVGTEGHPWPVRVEIPKWVADDPEKLNLLHAVLVDQCRMMGSKPYPYLLHRAHEDRGCQARGEIPGRANADAGIAPSG